MLPSSTLSAVSSVWSAYLILALYLASMVVITLVSRKKSSSLNSFYLSNRGIGGWMSAFAYGTTYFSAVIFLGFAGRFGLSMGLAAFWIGVANAFVGAMLAWLVLAKRTRRMTRNLEAKTMPEFFEKRYGDKNIKLLSSIIIFVLLIPYSTSVYQGLGYIFESVFGISFKLCILIMAGFTALYLFVGGYFAEALSDFVQGIVMLLGVALMLAFMIKSSYVNGAEGFNKLFEAGYGFFPSYTSPDGKFYNSAGFNLIVTILLTSFGIWGLPQSIHKFYTVKDNGAIKKGIVISTVFSLVIGGGAYLNGGFSKLFFQNNPPAADTVVPTMFDMAGFNPALLGLISVLVLSASMSTLSALSLSSASTVSIDLYRGYIRKKAKDNEVKILMRVLCLVFIAVSAVLAIYKVDAIVTLMSLSWGTIAGCFIGPYIYGLYYKKATAAAAYASMIASLVITAALILVFGFLQTPDGTPFGAVIKSGVSRSPLIGVIAMLSSVIIVPIVSAFTKKPPAEAVEESFKKAE